MSELLPRLRFKEFDQSLSTNLLESIVNKKISYGIVQAGSHYEGGMPYIKSKNLNAELEIDLLERTSPEIAAKYKRSEVSPGDIVFSLRGNIGVSRIVPEQLLVANLTQGTARISLKDRYVAKYIQAELQTHRVKLRIDAVSKGSTFQEISLADLRQIEVLTPKEDEQQKIADFLTAVDSKINQLAEKHRLLKEYKKGVMQQLFSQQIRFKDDASKEFPDWEEYTLLELSDDGISNGVFNDPKNVGKGYRLINVKDMYTGDSIDCSKLTLLELEPKQFEKNRVKFGDIFFTRSSIVPSGIAYSNVCLSHDEDITYDGHLMKLSPKLELVKSQFLAYYLRSHKLRKVLVSRGKQSTMTTIAQDDIKDIELSIPCLKEQQKIAQFIQSIDKKMDAVALQIEQTKLFKKGLLQQMFV